jgi:glycogen synthase
MAIIVHFVPRGMDHEKYAEVMRRLDAAGAGVPAGRLHHTCYGDRKALRVTDIYDTPQSFEAFGKTLVPILAQLGIDVGQPDVIEVHNIVRG